MKIDRAFFVRTAIESLLIVFSVLLALFLNAAWSQRAERAATEEMLVNIRSELAANQVILDDWTERHDAILENLRSLRAGDTTGAIVNHRLQGDKVFGRSLVETMVRDTAWQTAKTTGLVRNLDLDCANLLTDIYSLQPVVEESIWRIVDRVQERESHREEYLPETLVLLDMGLQELRWQENLLVDAYDAAIALVDEGECVR